jgi:hypothetical protein
MPSSNTAMISSRAMIPMTVGPPTALFGAAAILEIIHPDADEYGPYGKATSAFVAGRSAARTAGLPETLHVRITGKKVETARLIGDLGLILKDIVTAVMAAGSNPGWLTSDRVEVLTGGHGMLNIPVVAACNVIATELRRGVSPQVRFADAVHQPIDDLLTNGIAVAKAATCSRAFGSDAMVVLSLVMGRRSPW